ncbi:MAG: hypothetical protein EXR68_00775 [Dehalococcoidia bacterium]|nr:hypothetical protein [Dehalococcoidia bacterium]
MTTPTPAPRIEQPQHPCAAQRPGTQPTLIRRSPQARAGQTQPLSEALKVGLLAFDATKTSASDVDYPVDVVTYRPDTFTLQEQRFSGQDLDPLRSYWQNAIEAAVTLADPVMQPLVWRLDNAPPAHTHYGDNDPR